MPHETNAKVLLVVGGQNGSTDPFSDPYTKPENYTVIASADATHTGTVTFTASDYIQGLPRAAELKLSLILTRMFNLTLVISLLYQVIARLRHLENL